MYKMSFTKFCFIDLSYL